MNGERVERRLAAILAADVAGYSRLMGQDEAGTLARLRAHRRDLIDPKITEHRGRIVKTTGDGILIEFPSVVEAVTCAVAVQRGMADRNVGVPEYQQIVFRVGVNLGDIIIAEDDDIHGDGVNVAARLEGIAEPGGICVSGIVHDQVRDKLELAFDDLGEQALKNIARPVRVYRVHLANAEKTPSTSRVETTPIRALPDKPSIAVLPFKNMSGDPEQEYFADGMVEEIITSLSRIRWLFVIARNSTFTYKGQAVDVKQVGRELGVRYVLEGSVRRGGNRVRITGQLIDAETGTHLWADRFDGSLEDVFDLQDKIATSVAGVIEPALQAAETIRSTNRPTNDLTAYDFYLRAIGRYSLYSSDAMCEALGLLERAIDRDANYALALALASICHLHIDLNASADDAMANRRSAVERGRTALRFGGEDPVVLANASFALSYFGEDIEAMMALMERALVLNPSYARGWFLSGTVRVWAGQSDVAVEQVKTALRLSPRGTIGTPNLSLGMAHFFARRFGEALAALRIALQEFPAHPAVLRFLAATYAYMGQLENAREAIERLREITPALIQPNIAVRDPKLRELLVAGLRLAAGETT